MASQLIIRTAQILGITGSACLAGFIGSFSYAVVPSIEEGPLETQVKQWRTAYYIGASTAPPLALASAACFGFLAYSARGLPALKLASHVAVSRAALYATAAVAVPLIVPYTLLFMGPAVNHKLLSIAAVADQGKKGADVGISEGELKQVMRKWKSMNYNRAAFVALGSLLGAIATIAV